MGKLVKSVAAVTLAGSALVGAGLVGRATASGPAACSRPSLPSGDSMSIDDAGNGTSPASGGLEFVCTDGTWVRVTGYGSQVSGR